MRKHRPLVAMGALLLMAAGAPGAEQADRAVSFNEHIRPIFTKHCVACHGGPKQAAGLSLLRRASALSESDSGIVSIVPGDPDESYLLDRVEEPDDDFRMPPAGHGPRLSEKEIALLREWIATGAEWQEHWSLMPPQAPPVPEAKSGEWRQQPLDYFVLRRLDAEGLKPTPEASREAWLRRVSFDLIGLPPSEQEIVDFLADDQPGAHERVVDRLLASPHYGERWASVWLDLARYSDTKGYERDPPRDIWPYRDWLIRAFNDDLPYDQFTIKQLAGDLLPNPTLDDRLATAFHRNTQTNTEGGTDDEEFRTAAVIDRVNTTWQVWQGITFGCAQCHDHAYDAFTRQDYYRFLAFFNSTRDSDLPGDEPTLATPLDTEEFAQANAIDDELRAIRRVHQAPLAELAGDAEQWRRLTFDQLDSTGQTELSFDKAEGEVVASGTITSKSRYTLAGPAPAMPGPVTALRIDALPKDLAAAIKNPELGFMLTRLRLFIEPPEPKENTDGEPAEPEVIEVHFAEVVCDEPNPMFDQGESLKDNNRGWAAYSRMWAPRWAVFLLDEPLEIPLGARLRMEWKHERSLDGQGATVIRRARVSMSSDSRWRELLEDPEAVARLDRMAELQQQRRAIKSLNVPVFAERDAGHTRRTFVFERGNWLAKGEEVQPGTPPSMPRIAKRADGPLTRLDMAKWLMSEDNPLTSRTMVNRVWSELFGVGIAETLGDLGASGEPPAHPELLDHLALRFQGGHRWRIKSLLREIALSATYRQDAKVSPELAERDPRNRLLARGPRQRLSAEMMRDQALVVSGKFSPKQFGEPVMPYQPDGIWRTVYSSAKWETSEGDDRYRRAVYTYWKRTSGYPSMLTFDVPSREVCSVRRVVTNTPLQALVTMNDPAYVELAHGVAELMEQRVPGDPRAQIEWAYQAAAGKPATQTVVDELLAVYGDALTRYADDPTSCGELADSAECFARTVVANVIFNLDEVLTR